ncbi:MULTISPECIES: hypothetical protein [unclassified Bradyrhizobium]|uniref:hypothetical protein n=1 Tax=unclassified Bradyrhizobium TaxID=2631580 RepID=UPI0029163274|nr:MULTISPECIES: hypothetical protein [unclassified Bradyrhizobium]
MGAVEAHSASKQPAPQRKVVAVSDSRKPQVTQESSADVIDFPARSKPHTSWTKAACSDWLEMWAPRLTNLQFKVAFVISRHADSETGEAGLSLPTIAEEAGISKSDASKATKGLAESGCMDVKPGRRGAGHHGEYRLRAGAGELQKHKEDLAARRREKREAYAARKSSAERTLKGTEKGTEKVRPSEMNWFELEELRSPDGERAPVPVDRGDAPMNGAPPQLDEVLQSYPHASEPLRQTIASALRSGMTPAQIYAATPLAFDDDDAEAVSAIRLHLPIAPAYATGLTHTSSC